MSKTRVFLIILLSVVSGWTQSSPVASRAPESGSTLDGKWWFRANIEERSGFINGAADCLTWVAREDGYNATPEQVAEAIGEYYRKHPGAVDLPVVDVWKKVAVIKEATKRTEGEQAENWRNAHWYLNGDWWGSISLSEEKGYLEGYLWCMKNRVVSKKDRYSQSVDFYRKKIDAYIQTHPKSGSEAIAVILYLFRDGASAPK